MPPLVRFGMKTPMGKGFLKHYDFEEAYFFEKASQFRAALAMPLMLLGGINRLDTMERAMAAGFDFVAMGRALLREPDLVNRLQSGRQTAGECIHCNRCMPTIYSGTRCPEIPPALFRRTRTCSSLSMSQVVPDKPLRVVVWSTGTIGRHAIAGIDAHPDLELVGVWVSNPDKDGKDAGDPGRPRPRARDQGHHRPGRADRPGAGRDRAHRDGRRPGLRVHRGPDLVRRGRHQRHLAAARCCCSGRRRSCRRSSSRGSQDACDKGNAVDAHQRHRPRLRQRHPAAGDDQPQPAHRRGAGHGDLRLLDVLPAGRHGRHVRLRPADGLRRRSSGSPASSPWRGAASSGRSPPASTSSSTSR